MAESIDEKCIDEEGDPCMYSELCKGKPYGWDGCLMTKTEKTDSVPVEQRVKHPCQQLRDNGSACRSGKKTKMYKVGNKMIVHPDLMSKIKMKFSPA